MIKFGAAGAYWFLEIHVLNEISAIFIQIEDFIVLQWITTHKQHEKSHNGTAYWQFLNFESARKVLKSIKNPNYKEPLPNYLIIKILSKFSKEECIPFHPTFFCLKCFAKSEQMNMPYNSKSFQNTYRQIIRAGEVFFIKYSSSQFSNPYYPLLQNLFPNVRCHSNDQNEVVIGVTIMCRNLGNAIFQIDRSLKQPSCIKNLPNISSIDHRCYLNKD